MDLNTQWSLVDRTHVNRYLPNSELPNIDNLNNDENLEVGEYVVKNIQTIIVHLLAKAVQLLSPCGYH